MRTSLDPDNHTAYWEMRVLRRRNRKARQDLLYVWITDGFPRRKMVASLSDETYGRYGNVFYARKYWAYLERTPQEDELTYRRRLA